MKCFKELIQVEKSMTQTSGNSLGAFVLHEVAIMNDDCVQETQGGLTTVAAVKVDGWRVVSKFSLKSM